MDGKIVGQYECGWGGLGEKESAARDLYAFEEELRDLHPKNKHIRPKIRQQLRVLRFQAKGWYEMVDLG